MYWGLGLSLNEIGSLLGAPDSNAAQNWAKELRSVFTGHFYICTPQIPKSPAESYAGEGTGAFAKQVIDAYLTRLY
jgi:hypothetical protein